MILRRDFDAPRREILHGLVRASVSELQLERLGAQGQTKELVAEADPEDRLLAQKAAHALDGVAHGGRVSGAIRKEHAVGLEAENVVGARGRRDYRQPAPRVDQAAENVAFDAVVEDYDVQGRGSGRRRGPRAQAVGPGVGLLRGDLAHEIQTVHVRRRASSPQERLRALGSDGRVLRADVPKVASQLASVDIRNTDDATSRKVAVERSLRSPVGWHRAFVSDHEPGDPGLAVHGLRVLRVHADVADLRRRHRHDLAVVRGVGQDFLVAGQRRREDGLPRGYSPCAEGPSFEDGAVRQHEPRSVRVGYVAQADSPPRASPNTTRPAHTVISTRPSTAYPPKGVL